MHHWEPVRNANPGPPPAPPPDPQNQKLPVKPIHVCASSSLRAPDYWFSVLAAFKNHLGSF